MRTLFLTLAVLSSVSMTVHAAPAPDDREGVSPPALESTVNKADKGAERATEKVAEKGDKVDFERRNTVDMS